MQNKGVDWGIVVLILLAIALVEGFFRLHPEQAMHWSNSKGFKVFRRVFWWLLALCALIALIFGVVEVIIAVWHNIGTQTCTSVNC